jgi:hypothetical protein
MLFEARTSVEERVVAKVTMLYHLDREIFLRDLRFSS